GQPILGRELRMAPDAVLGGPDHRRAGLGELRRERAERLGFVGAAGGVVLRIEVEHQGPAPEVGRADRPVGAFQLELRRLRALDDLGHLHLPISRYPGRSEAESRDPGGPAVRSRLGRGSALRPSGMTGRCLGRLYEKDRLLALLDLEGPMIRQDVGPFEVVPYRWFLIVDLNATAGNEVTSFAH